MMMLTMIMLLHVNLIFDLVQVMMIDDDDDKSNYEVHIQKVKFDSGIWSELFVLAASPGPSTTIYGWWPCLGYEIGDDEK